MSAYQTEPEPERALEWPRPIDQRSLDRMRHEDLDWLAIQLERQLRKPGKQAGAMEILKAYRESIPAAAPYPNTRDWPESESGH